MPQTQVTMVDDPRRPHSISEEIADGCVHVVGIAAGLSGTILLVSLAATRDGPTRIAAIVVYALALLGMLCASAAYNIFYGTRWRELFRHCDHSAIFLLIAGTFTPFTTAFTDVMWAIGLSTTVWSITAGGIVLKFTRPALFERVCVGLYLAQGWLGIVIFGPLAMQLTTFTMATLVAGGLLYTIGVIFHLWERLPFHNAIWHLFVLAAALCHYLAVLHGIVLAPVGVA